MVAILVIIDTLTKWFGVVDKYNNDNGMECDGYNTFRGIFFRAWKEGYLESRKLRSRELDIQELNALKGLTICRLS